MATKTDFFLKGIVIFGGLVMIAALVLGWWIYRAFVPYRIYYDWNEIFTATVQTPTGIVEDTTILTYSAGYAPEPNTLSPAIAWYATGEALALQLTPDTYLFISPGRAYPAVPRLAREAGALTERRHSRAYFAAIQALSGPYDYTPATGYPEMILVPNIDFPTHAVPVAPDTLSMHLGPGYRITSLTRAITDEDPGPSRIEATLQGWFEQRDQYGVVPNLPISRIGPAALTAGTAEEIGLSFFFAGGDWRDIWHRLNTECVEDYSDYRRNPEGPPWCIGH
ncbi:hypothetical protein [Gymnodinialimonas hymeniacidonis]|uniref:hypothetical protein n=1 Tax=Gymnodinialimonas hymeniacidonis TaxID=3126508 RepID=UPI0034C64376